MVDTEDIKQAIAKAVVEKTKVPVLAICEEDRRQNTHPQQIGASVATRHRIGPSLRLSVFNWTAKDNCLELKNLKIQVTNILLTDIIT